MRTLKSYIAISAVSLALISCESAPKNETRQPKDTVVEEHHDHNDSMKLRDDSAEAIELNNGAKWEVNAEMKPYALKGHAIVKSYIQNNRTDYSKLSAEIAKLNDDLIQSCTMQGKSHEELHKWLHPHLELVEELSKASDSAKAYEIAVKLEKSYEKYGEYFK